MSAANVTVWATDSTGTKIISQADQVNYPTTATAYTPLEFSLPYTAGNQYYIFVKDDATPASAQTEAPPCKIARTVSTGSLSSGIPKMASAMMGLPPMA